MLIMPIMPIMLNYSKLFPHFPAPLSTAQLIISLTYPEILKSWPVIFIPLLFSLPLPANNNLKAVIKEFITGII